MKVLRWKRLDLYLGNLNQDDKAERAELEELNLFSSGKRAVHDDWCNRLLLFPNVNEVFDA